MPSDTTLITVVICGMVAACAVLVYLAAVHDGGGVTVLQKADRLSVACEGGR